MGATADEHATGAVEDRAATLTQLRQIVDRAAPPVLAHERTLPLLGPLEPLLPGGALRRGTAVGVTGSGATSLALALVAGPTRAGSWAACVGFDHLGWAAARELGVDLARTVVVRAVERSWPTVVAALVDAFDVVLCGPQQVPGAADARRLVGRARERGAVLVAVCDGRRRSWPDLDVRCQVGDGGWSGPEGGWGRLRARRVAVSATGRAGLARARRVDLWLPASDGGVATVDPAMTDVAPSAPRGHDDEHPAVRHAAGSLRPARRGPPSSGLAAG
jgi:hypothetical protein